MLKRRTRAKKKKKMKVKEGRLSGSDDFSRARTVRCTVGRRKEIGHMRDET